MDRKQLDLIKSKLGVASLSENDKKRLFNDFVEAGGEVLEVKEKQNVVKPTKRRDISKSVSSSRSHAQRVRQAKTIAKKSETSLSKQTVSSKRKTTKSPISRWIERSGATLSCVFAGILKWNRREYSTGFYRLLGETTQNSLLNIQMVLASVIHQNSKITAEIKAQLNRGQSLNYDYELLYRLEDLYEESFFEKLKEFRGDLLEVSRSTQEIISFFKQLFVLKAHVGALKSAGEKALLIERKLRRLPGDVYSENIRKLFSNIDFLFERLYPKLAILTDYFYKQSGMTEVFSVFLRMGESDELGYYTLKWKESLEAEEQKQRLIEDRKQQDKEVREGDVNQSDGDLKSDEVLEKGFQVLSEMLNLHEKLKEYRSKKDLRALFTFKDKVFVTYSLIDLFEQEYSFIFTSGKVVFNVAFQQGGRLDVRKELAEYYYRFNGIYERVNEYLKILRDIYKVEQDHYLGMGEKSAKLNQFSVHRSQISRKVRKEAFDIFEKISHTMIFVLTDYEESRSILRNGEEELDFGHQIEKNRRSNGKKTIAVVEEAYQICYTIRFLLSDGDLGGFSVSLEKPRYMKRWMQESSNVVLGEE